MTELGTLTTRRRLSYAGWIVAVALLLALLITNPHVRTHWYLFSAKVGSVGPFESFEACRALYSEKQDPRAACNLKYELAYGGISLPEAILVAATLGLALYTARLFRATREVAEDTVQASQLADIHHQETLRPVVVWDTRVWFIDQTPSGLPPAGTVRLNGNIINIGGGPAIEIKISEFTAQSLTPLGPHGPVRLGHLGTNAQMAKFLDLEVQASPYGAGEHWPPFRLVLEYEDVFGKLHRTIHESGGGPKGEVTTMLEFPLPLVRIAQIWKT